MIRLEDFWSASLVPIFDMDTSELIDSDVMVEHKNAEVVNFRHGRCGIQVKYDKEVKSC